jgi:hypothetical protein
MTAEATFVVIFTKDSAARSNRFGAAEANELELEKLTMAGIDFQYFLAYLISCSEKKV